MRYISLAENFLAMKYLALLIKSEEQLSPFLQILQKVMAEDQPKNSSIFCKLLKVHWQKHIHNFSLLFVCSM